MWFLQAVGFGFGVVAGAVIGIFLAAVLSKKSPNAEDQKRIAEDANRLLQERNEIGARQASSLAYIEQGIAEIATHLRQKG